MKSNLMFENFLAFFETLIGFMRLTEHFWNEEEIFRQKLRLNVNRVNWNGSSAIN